MRTGPLPCPRRARGLCQSCSPSTLQRALEEAERSAAERRAGSKGAETSKPSVPQLRPSAAQADKPKASDPRLRAPERRAVEMVWRPGAATWNTDEQKGDGRQEESRLQVRRRGSRIVLRQLRGRSRKRLL